MSLVLGPWSLVLVLGPWFLVFVSCYGLGRDGRQGASGERRAALAKGTRSRARGINPEPIRPMCHIAMPASSNSRSCDAKKRLKKTCVCVSYPETCCVLPRAVVVSYLYLVHLSFTFDLFPFTFFLSPVTLYLSPCRLMLDA